MHDGMLWGMESAHQVRAWPACLRGCPSSHRCLFHRCFCTQGWTARPALPTGHPFPCTAQHIALWTTQPCFWDRPSQGSYTDLSY